MPQTFGTSGGPLEILPGPAFGRGVVCRRSCVRSIAVRHRRRRLSVGMAIECPALAKLGGRRICRTIEHQTCRPLYHDGPDEITTQISLRITDANSWFAKARSEIKATFIMDGSECRLTGRFSGTYK